MTNDTQYQRPQTSTPSADDFNPADLPPSSPVATRSDAAAPDDLAAVLEALRTQNTWLERIAVMIRAERAERPLNRVKIEDINMPFWHMVGLIIKFNMASSPIVVVLAGLLILVIGLCGGATLLAALGAVLRR